MLSMLLAPLSYWRLAGLSALLSCDIAAADGRSVEFGWPWASLAAPSIGIQRWSRGIRVAPRLSAARWPAE